MTTGVDPDFAYDAYPQDDPLAGLGATAEERLAFYESLAEYEAEEWDEARAAEEEAYQEQMAQLAEIGDQVDDHVTSEAVRQAEDEADAEWLTTRPSVEDKIASSLGRAERGTLVPHPYFRPARDTEGMFSVSCGEAVDATGRCASRYHQAGCHTITEGAAATGSAEAAEAWRNMLLGYTPPPSVAGAAEEMGLASPTDPQPGSGMDTWADILEPEPGVADPRLHARLMHYLGEADAPPPEPRPDHPDTTALRAILGL
jgi:hypothetical protein